MDYILGLILRLLIALVLVLTGSKLIYALLFWPTFYLSYIFLYFFNATIINSSIFVSGQELVFTPACVATSAYILLCVLILLTKDIDMRKGIKMFFTGFFVLFIVNILRIWFLGFVLINYNLKLFEDFHMLLWQGFSTVFVFLLWIYLTKAYNVHRVPIYSDFIYLRKKLK